MSRPRSLTVPALTPCLLVIGMWLISTMAGMFPLFDFAIRGTLVEVTSTSWRALEVAVVSKPLWTRGVEYCVLPKAHAPVLGMYLGSVAVPAPSTCVILLVPYYALFLAAASWPVTLWWRARRRRMPPRGFEVDSATEPGD